MRACMVLDRGSHAPVGVALAQHGVYGRPEYLGGRVGLGAVGGLRGRHVGRWKGDSRLTHVGRWKGDTRLTHVGRWKGDTRLTHVGRWKGDSRLTHVGRWKGDTRQRQGDSEAERTKIGRGQPLLSTVWMTVEWLTPPTKH